MGKLLVMVSLEAVVVDAMLVGPDAGENARPAGTADRVVLSIPLAEDQASRRMNAVLDQGIETRRVRFLDRVEPRAVNADVEDFLDRLGSARGGIEQKDAKSAKKEGANHCQSRDQWS